MTGQLDLLTLNPSKHFTDSVKQANGKLLSSPAPVRQILWLDLLTFLETLDNCFPITAVFCKVLVKEVKDVFTVPVNISDEANLSVPLAELPLLIILS